MPLENEEYGKSPPNHKDWSFKDEMHMQRASNSFKQLDDLINPTESLKAPISLKKRTPFTCHILITTVFIACPNYSQRATYHIPFLQGILTHPF